MHLSELEGSHDGGGIILIHPEYGRILVLSTCMSPWVIGMEGKWKGKIVDVGEYDDEEKGWFDQQIDETNGVFKPGVEFEGYRPSDLDFIAKLELNEENGEWMWNGESASTCEYLS